MLEQHRHQCRLVVVRDDCGDAGQRNQVFAGAGGVTPRHDNPHRWILAGDLPDQLPGAVVGGSGNRTRVDDNQVGLLRVRWASAGGSELSLDIDGIRLVDPAPKGGDSELHDRELTGPQYSPEASASTPAADLELAELSRKSPSSAPDPPEVARGPGLYASQG